MKVCVGKLLGLEVIRTAYTIHEEYAYAKFDYWGKIYLCKEYNVRFLDSSDFEKRITKLGVNSRSLVEAGLFYGGLSGIPSEEDMNYVMLLVDRIVTWAKNLDLFYYSSKLFPDFKLEVTNTGDLLFTHDQRFIDQQESVVRKFALEREKVHYISLLERTSAMQSSKIAKRKVFYERYSAVNEVYQSRFGYKFTDTLKFLVGISDLFPKDRSFGICIVPRKKLLQKLSEKTGFSLEKTEKIFDNFEFTKHELMREGFPNWRFKRKFSLLWRPIVSVSIGTRKIYSVAGYQFGRLSEPWQTYGRN